MTMRRLTLLALTLALVCPASLLGQQQDEAARHDHMLITFAWGGKGKMKQVDTSADVEVVPAIQYGMSNREFTKKADGVYLFEWYWNEKCLLQYSDGKLMGVRDGHIDCRGTELTINPDNTITGRIVYQVGYFRREWWDIELAPSYLPKKK
jgi:hypothetical protein